MIEKVGMNIVFVMDISIIKFGFDMCNDGWEFMVEVIRFLWIIMMRFDIVNLLYNYVL